jgi:SEC-C motif domain protein
MPANERRKYPPSVACPCGNGQLAECCGRFIHAGGKPATALELMRSRYTAYALRNEAYLQTTWYGSTRPAARLLEEENNIKWLSLEILSHQQEGSAASVEFVARFKVHGRAQDLHEISRFVYEDGQWYYLDGSFPSKAK